MTLCGMDPAHYNGPITYAPVKAQDYWRIEMAAVTVEGIVITTTADAIVDTGTSLLTGPTDAIRQVRGTTIASISPLETPREPEEAPKH